jgi:peptidoglycan/LPS O-acetylase OafA/YrhL
MTYVGNQGNSWLLPTWSLAVEEQFYILLPLIVFFVSPRSLFRISLALIAVAPILRASLLFAGETHEIGAYVLLPCRWDLLFLGVIAALIWRDKYLWTLVRQKNALPLKVAALASGWTVVALMGAERILDVSLLHPVGLLFLGICTASYILLIVSDGSKGTILNSRGLGFLGSISYGLYLIHQPVAGLLHRFLLGTRPDTANIEQTLVTVAALVISVMLAWLSWKFFESKIVQIGHRWKYTTREPGTDSLQMAQQPHAYSGQTKQ